MKQAGNKAIFLRPEVNEVKPRFAKKSPKDQPADLEAEQNFFA